MASHAGKAAAVKASAAPKTLAPARVQQNSRLGRSSLSLGGNRAAARMFEMAPRNPIQRETGPAVQSTAQKQVAQPEDPQTEYSWIVPQPKSPARNPALQNALGTGSPIPSTLRSDLESRFDFDLSGVRVHNGPRAAGLAAFTNAKAYTDGGDIVFGAGHFSPDTPAGRQLLAHEVAHVVQQSRGGAPAPGLDSHNPLETDARRAAMQFSDGQGRVQVHGASAPGIAREEASSEPWWRRRLRPLSQAVRQKLQDVAPKQVAQFDRVVDVGKDLVRGARVSDEDLNNAVKAAEPVLTPLSNVLKVKIEPPPPPQPPEKADPSKTVWLGKPPLAVQTQQKQEARKFERENPGELAPPPVKQAVDTRGISVTNFKPDPPPTEFETKVKAGKRFEVAVTIEPDIDLRNVIWTGRRPSDAALRSNQIGVGSAEGAPPSFIAWGPQTHRQTINPDFLIAIRAPQTNELKGYRYREGETLLEFDRNGRQVSSRGLEAPLETPVIDPIDIALLGFDLGPVAAKALTGATKALLRTGAKEALTAEGKALTRVGEDVIAGEGEAALKKGGTSAVKSATRETADEVAEEAVSAGSRGEVQLDTGAGDIDWFEPTRLPDGGSVSPRRVHGLQSGRAGPGRNVKPGTLEDLESTGLGRARRPRRLGPTRAQQLEGLELGGKNAGQVAREEFERKLRPEWASKLGIRKGDVLHHAKELDLLNRYPGVFTQDELNAFANMRAIPKRLNPEVHLKAIRGIWDEAYEFIDSVIAERGLQPRSQEYNEFVRSVVESTRRRVDSYLPTDVGDFGKF